MVEAHVYVLPILSQPKHNDEVKLGWSEGELDNDSDWLGWSDGALDSDGLWIGQSKGELVHWT